MADIFTLVRDSISLYDLMDEVNPPVRYQTREIPCQISCPFHGADTHPSARVYPDTNTMRCFVCSKSWDVISFWAEANAIFKDDGTYSFYESAQSLCEKFGLSYETYDWETKFYALRSDSLADKSYKSLSEPDREKLRNYYTWRFGQLVLGIPTEVRTQKMPAVLNCCDELLSIDLSCDEWKTNLTDWYSSAKLEL